MREDLKGRHLSFTEIAKLVGENWQNLSASEKEPYEAQAFAAKEKYNNEMVEYKKTESYGEYTLYLNEFKAKQNQHQHQASVDKRPKLETELSNASSGTDNSVTNQSVTDMSKSHIRGHSVGSAVAQWAPATVSGTANLPVGHGNVLVDKSVKSSPIATSPTILPGYRESLFNSSKQNLAWRDARRDVDYSSQAPKLPGIASIEERRPERSLASGSPANFSVVTQASHHSSGHGYTPPPLLTSESTSGSSGSAASSLYVNPRTPLEPPIGSFPIPSISPQKHSALYEHQLPPIQSPSYSPPNLRNVSSQSQPVIPSVEYSRPLPLPRSSSPHSSQSRSPGGKDDRALEVVSVPYGGEGAMDPFSVLLRAGEIASRNSLKRSPS